MYQTTQPIEVNLDRIATICCDAINGDSDAGLDQIDALLKSLLLSGYGRRGRRPLQVDLETLVKQKCGGCLESGASDLRSLSGKIAKQFAELARGKSESPGGELRSVTNAVSVASD